MKTVLVCLIFCALTPNLLARSPKKNSEERRKFHFGRGGVHREMVPGVDLAIGRFGISGGYSHPSNEKDKPQGFIGFKIRIEKIW